MLPSARRRVVGGGLPTTANCNRRISNGGLRINRHKNSHSTRFLVQSRQTHTPDGTSRTIILLLACPHAKETAPRRQPSSHHIALDGFDMLILALWNMNLASTPTPQSETQTARLI
jgi:hypothetical protein